VAEDGALTEGRKPVFWRGAMALAAVWMASLTILAATTANPIVVNSLQVARAEIVVSGTVSDVASERLRVQREWKQGKRLAEITVRGLSQLPVEPGNTYILPLSRVDADIYQIVPLPVAAPGSPIYPLTAQTRCRLEQILAALERKPSPAGPAPRAAW